MKKCIKNIFFILILIGAMFMFASPCYAGKYEKHLSKGERESLCNQLKSQHMASLQGASSLGGGIIPDNVLTSIYNTTKNISDKTALLLTMGHSLTCHAVHAGKNSVEIMGLTLFDYPDISVWLCGAIVYIVGFMMTLSICFYLADIAFKLGFAVIMLPIGIALWPFPVTKDKLTILISIILKNAAIFAFLAITVSYALSLVDTATNAKMDMENDAVEALKEWGIDLNAMLSEKAGFSWEEAGGMQKLFFMISNNMTDLIAENFTLFSTYFLVILVALVYGFKLIGATIPDYVDKFFPDKAFGSASPIHGSMTQAMDFVKKKTVDPVASFANDVVSTQAGNVLKGTGNLVAGKYNNQIKNYWKNPGDISKDLAHSVHKAGGSLAKGTSSVLMGTVGRIALNKSAREDLQNKINSKIDEGTDYLDRKADSVAGSLNNAAHKVGDARREFVADVQEKFDNSAVGKKVNQATAAVQKAHSQVQSKYEKSLDALREKRKDISHTFNEIKLVKSMRNFRNGDEEYREQLKADPSVDMDNLSDKDYLKAYGFNKTVDRKTNNIIQKRNERRDNINNAVTTFRKNIDKVGVLAKSKHDGKLKAAAKWTGRMALKTLKPALAVADGLHRTANGAATLGLNVLTTAGGGIAKMTSTIATGAVLTPFNITEAVAKTPSVIAEGALRAANVTKNAGHVKKAVKSTVNFTGEVLSQTGDQMGRNKRK